MDMAKGRQHCDLGHADAVEELLHQVRLPHGHTDPCNAILLCPSQNSNCNDAEIGALWSVCN